MFFSILGFMPRIYIVRGTTKIVIRSYSAYGRNLGGGRSRSNGNVRKSSRNGYQPLPLKRGTNKKWTTNKYLKRIRIGDA